MTDLQFALRRLARRRTVSAVAIGTLARGIGAATAIYSVVDSVLLKPLPFADPSQIASVWITQPGLAKDPVLSWLATATPMGSREYDALRRNTRALRDVAMWSRQAVTLTTDQDLIEKSYAGERYRTVVITVFGVVASLLAAVGSTA